MSYPNSGIACLRGIISGKCVRSLILCAGEGGWLGKEVESKLTRQL